MPERFPPWIEFTKPSKMNQHDQAKKQFENVIKNDLNRWFMESDLDAQDLAGECGRQRTRTMSLSL
ncbi:MAG: hypothetical protein CMI33_09250 [Opitutales bacterium]|nr:hypothetical protein [Opitutales bacterium]